jgi:hypothetical protein
LRTERSDYWTIFSLVTLVVVSPFFVTVCSTSAFSAVASFSANLLFGFSETIFDYKYVAISCLARGRSALRWSSSATSAGAARESVYQG